MSPWVTPSIIEEVVSSGAHNSLVKEAKAQGRPLIGVTCTLVPVPILSVGGMSPIRLRHTHGAGTPLADTYLSSVLCHYPRNLLEAALEGALEVFDGFVFASGCDHLRRLYDNLGYLIEPAFNHIVDVPHRAGSAARGWYEEELRTLVQRLQVHFGVDLSDEALSVAIERHNEYCALVRELGELRKLEKPPMSGADFHRLLVAGQVAPRDMIEPQLKRALTSAADSRGDDGRTWRARLLVVGSLIDDPRYLDIIESVGGLVVADRFCVGSLPGYEPYQTGGDPIAALAAHTLERSRFCPRMMGDFDRRLNFIESLVEEYNVDGVVVESMKFCDLWGVESSLLVRELRERGVRVLRLERVYVLSGEGQMRTRVQAFLESMGR